MCKETKEAKKSSHGEQESRFVITGYVCANCDTDFGENEFGCMVEDGIHTSSCPICGCNILYVYHVVSHDRRQIPAPTMSKEVLNLLQKQKDNKFFEHVIPADGMHGVEVYDLANEEQVGCGGCGGDDDEECCDGKECCCPTRGDYCTPRVSDLQKAIEDERIAKLDAQVKAEREHRRKEFKRVLDCLRNPTMEK